MEERDRKAEPLSVFAPSPVNAALVATLVLLRSSKELSGEGKIRRCGK